MPNPMVQRRRWAGRVETWEHHVTSSPAFARVRIAVLDQAGARPGDQAVDLGAGTGFLSLLLAEQVANVLAVDIAEPMLQKLAAAAAEAGLDNVEVLCADLTEVDLPAGCVDLVVSSYALHHLTDPQKAALLRRVRRWLRPGGRVVVADMMFGRGRTRRDRAIIWGKVRRLVGKGPAGAWRVVKNVVRFGLRWGTERPAAPEFWVRALRDGGFVDVGYRPIVQEAGLVVGRVPDS
jgi:2-polyprenyl-3-methyl-5-hydroxy-6-metoxy-1,4-benzoquinol methylase